MKMSFEKEKYSSYGSKSIQTIQMNCFCFLFVISATLALKSNYLVDWESSFWRLMMYYGK